MLFACIITNILAIALPSLRISPLLLIRIATIALLYAAALSFNVVYIQSIGSGIGIFSGLFHVTLISQSIETFFYLVGALILMPWSLSNTPQIKEYPLVILFTVLGGSLLISAADLVSMYLSIELQSFAVYVLASIYKDSESATSAGLKYFLLGGLSSCLILLGCGLIYTYTGLTDLESIYTLIFSNLAELFNPVVVECVPMSIVPIIIYFNAETDKSKIFSDNKGRAAIYLWTHKESGKRYVGSAVNLSERMHQYFSLSWLKRVNNYITRALIHHTHSAFSLSILEYIDISNLSKEEARKLILGREQYYLDLIFSEDEPNTFNILKVAGSLLGFQHSEESIALMSGENNHFFGKTHSAEAKALMSEAKKGFKHTVETQAKLSELAWGRTHTLETKGKISESQKNRLQNFRPLGFAVSVLDLVNNNTTEYLSIAQAAKELGLNPSSISKRMKKGITSAFKGRYVITVKGSEFKKPSAERAPQ